MCAIDRSVMTNDANDLWLSVLDAYPLLRAHFRSIKTFQRHLGQREDNGLIAAGAVRMTPFKRLLVNPARIRAWAMGEGTQVAA